MFPKKLSEGGGILATNGFTPGNDLESKYVISDNGYGKNYVKILHVKREGLVHHVKEFEVNSHLQLFSKATYLTGK